MGQCDHVTDAAAALGELFEGLEQAQGLPDAARAGGHAAIVVEELAGQLVEPVRVARAAREVSA